MNLTREKISIRQAMIMLLALTYSPSMRVIASLVPHEAKQAAWLSPIISVGMLLILVFIFSNIYKGSKNKELSLMDIMYDIFGKVIGKILVFVYILYMIFIAAYYTRYFGERLISTVFTGISISFTSIVILLLIAISLQYELVVLARMCEVIFPILLFVFIILGFAILPEIDLKNLTPISYKDIIPIGKGSLVTSAIFVYYSFSFFFSEKISNHEHIKKTGIQVSLFFLVAIPLILVICIGTLGDSILIRTPFPYLSTIKNISLFNTIEKAESVVVSLWIMSDFILISFFSYISLNMTKSLFKLKDRLAIKNVLIVLIFILSLGIAGNKFELEALSMFLISPLNLFFGFLIPVVLFLVGKMRRKI